MAVFDDEDTQRIGVPKPVAEPPLAPLGHEARKLIFGAFTFHPDPQPGNPEHVRIEEPWPSQHILSVQIPQLPKRTIQIHKLIRWQFVGLWQAWQDAGLLPLVLSFDGAWVPRFKRGRALPPYGTEADLSNHAFGTAFDVNAAYNPLGHAPLLPSTYGSTVPLAPLAQKWGFAWGGNFHGRVDAMHFECSRVMPAPSAPLPPPL
jgi:hypothetical protein